jgi:hypothetical protein
MTQNAILLSCSGIERRERSQKRELDLGDRTLRKAELRNYGKIFICHKFDQGKPAARLKARIPQQFCSFWDRKVLTSSSGKSTIQTESDGRILRESELSDLAAMVKRPRTILYNERASLAAGLLKRCNRATRLECNTRDFFVLEKSRSRDDSRNWLSILGQPNTRKSFESRTT